MRPLVIDFAPRRAPTGRSRWFAGGLGVLLLVGAGLAGWQTPAVEASHMAIPTAGTLPDEAEVLAVDAAVGELNLPWPAVFAALDAAFGTEREARLVRAEADLRHGIVRLTGEARDAAAAQRLPQMLREGTGITAARLVGIERNEGGTWPLQFVLEARAGAGP